MFMSGQRLSTTVSTEGSKLWWTDVAKKGVNLEFELVTIFKDIGEQPPICNAKQMTSVPVLKNK
jgi:hypothetical protein